MYGQVSRLIRSVQVDCSLVKCLWSGVLLCVVWDGEHNYGRLVDRLIVLWVWIWFVCLFVCFGGLVNIE